MKIIYDKKLLALALERKANPRYATESKFRYQNYDYDFEKEIFPSARIQFQKYDRAYKDNKDFAQAFARDLHRKNSQLIAEINKGAKTEEELIFYEEGPTAQAEEAPAEQPPVGEPASTMAGGAPFPGLTGTASSAPTPRRIVHIVPQAPEPETTTSSSSQATVKTTTTTTPAPSAKSGSATVTSSKGFTPTGSTSISSSTTSASGSTNIETKTQIHAPKTLATAGPSVDAVSKEATQPAKGIKSGGARFQASKISSAITNTERGLFSRAGMFLKKNFATLASAGTGFFAGLGITGGSVFGGLMGAAGGTALRFWAGGGGAGRFFNKFLNGSANFVNRLSFNIAGPKFSFAKAGGRKALIGVLIAMGGFFAFSLFSASTTPAVPETRTPEASPVVVGGAGCPDQATINQNKNPSSCHYLNPAINLFDTSISSDAIAQYIEKYSPIFINASKGSKLDFLQRVDYIVSNSKKAGLNPAIFLGYWKSESKFSTVGTRDMGCAGSDFYEEVNCALGIKEFADPVKNPIANCARSKDENSVSCNALKSVRKEYDKTHPVQYPLSNFDDFAESYGPYDHLVSGEPTNCTSTYNQLIEVAKELNACKAVIASCPVTGGQIKTPSYQASPTSGHCSPGYGSCNTSSRRAKAIDVDTQAQDVLFPTINSQSVSWKYITDLLLDKPGDCEGGVANCGRFYVFRADVGSDYWMLHLLHLDPNNLAFNRTDTGNQSRSTAGKTVPNVYLHTEIGKNIVNYSNPPLGSQDLDSGWIGADFMCK